MKMENELTCVEHSLKEIVREAPVHIRDVVSYALESSGKRIRPLLVMLSGKLFGASANTLVNAAVAVELMHIASLVHDDIIDEGMLRRGNESLHLRFGFPAAILCGDYLLCKSLNLLKGYNEEVMKKFTRAGMLMADGEMMDIDVSMNDYFECIGRKTAVLFEASTGMGAVIGEAKHSDVLNIERFGWHLGIAYQLTDDLLDYLGLWKDKQSVRKGATFPRLVERCEEGKRDVADLTLNLIHRHRSLSCGFLKKINSNREEKEMLIKLTKDITLGIIKKI